MAGRRVSQPVAVRADWPSAEVALPVVRRIIHHAGHSVGRGCAAGHVLPVRSPRPTVGHRPYHHRSLADVLVSLGLGQRDSLSGSTFGGPLRPSSGAQSRTWAVILATWP